MFVKSAVLCAMLSFIHASETSQWIREERETYTIMYTSHDQNLKHEYINMFNKGLIEVNAFFHQPFHNNFEIIVHPNRASLDSTWRKDWAMPAFQSECWMVASGVGNKLDVLSPARWETESCEHHYEDKVKTQQLITHELVHVLHGQYNASKDFSEAEGIDWLVEGLATYASGQCDTLRIAQIKTLINERQNPSVLDQFWSGKYKYGLSGSMIMYIDKTYGRAKLKSLLVYSKKRDILNALNISEEGLISGWKAFMQNL